MNSRNQKTELELVEDIDAERLEWRIQRVSWLAIAAVLVAGLLGLLGPGPMSSRSTMDAEGKLRLEYKRFLRFQAPSELRVEIKPTGENKAELWINSDFIQHVKVEAIVPPPQRAEFSNGGINYTFPVSPVEASSIIFHLEIERMGPGKIQMRLNKESTLEASLWVYP
jgi:hypothetical protein